MRLGEGGMDELGAGPETRTHKDQDTEGFMPREITPSEVAVPHEGRGREHSSSHRRSRPGRSH